MSHGIINERLGRYSGLIYMVLMGIGIPTLIYLDPAYSTDLNSFDPLSKLSQTEFSRNYYRSIHILGGILAFIYFELHFFSQRKSYWKLNNWKYSKISARVGCFGQIATGVFERDMFPIHLFAAAFFATGYVSCFVFICFNLDNQLKDKSKLSKMIILGYCISFIALMNALYFRYSAIRGIWQFTVILTSLCWYVMEALMYNKNSAFIDSNLRDESEISEINGATYILLASGIYLIVFAYLLHSRPKMWPWKCTENDETCQLPNVISLIIAGAILNLFSIYHILKVRRSKNVSTLAIS